MRYHFLTFQTNSFEGIPARTLRYYVMQFGKNYSYVRVHDNQANAFGGKALEIEAYNRNWRGCYCVNNVQHLFDYMQSAFSLGIHNVQMTELTKHQRQWLLSKDGFIAHDMMFNRLLSDGNLRSRSYSFFSRLREEQRNRLIYGGETKPYAKFKGNQHTASTFLRTKEVCNDLSKLVRGAISSGDTDDLAEFFVDRGADLQHYFSVGNALDSIKDRLSDKYDLDLDVVHCECGHFEHEDDTHDVRDSTWCTACFDEDAVYVEDRDEYWPRDDAYWSDNHDAYYSYDRDARDDDDEDESDPDSLMDYSTNVLDHLSKDSKIVSSQHGEFLMGIEFEMETEGRTHEAVTDVRQQLGDGYCVCKYDGSLGSGGLEIVTAPRGLPEHIGKFKGWVVDKQYRAWDRKRCGMHIHIDSKAFSQMTLGKFIMFINDSNNMEFIRKIAGRHPNKDEQARSYAAAEHQDVLINPSKAVKGKSYERYRMVNLQNLTVKESKRLGFGTRFDEGTYNTVELRIFRASLKKERLLAQIEFTHAAIMFCRVASWRELNQTTFLKWLKGSAVGLYPHLADWYGVRRRVPVHTDGKQAFCEDQVEAATEGD